MMNFGRFSSGSRNSLCFLFSPVADVGTFNRASFDFKLVFERLSHGTNDIYLETKEIFQKPTSFLASEFSS